MKGPQLICYLSKTAETNNTDSTLLKLHVSHIFYGLGKEAWFKKCRNFHQRLHTNSSLWTLWVSFQTPCHLRIKKLSQEHKLGLSFDIIMVSRRLWSGGLQWWLQQQFCMETHDNWSTMSFIQHLARRHLKDDKVLQNRRLKAYKPTTQSYHQIVSVVFRRTI